MKIVRRGALPVGGDSGLLEIRDRAVRGHVRGTGPGTGPRARHLAGVRRAASSRSSTRARSGRCAIVIDAANGMAGAMLPPVLERLLQVEAVALLLRAGRHLPEPRAEPAAAREPRVHRREDARGGRRLRGRVRRRRRPLLLRRRHGGVRARRLHHGAARRGRCSRRSPARRSSTTSARAGRCRETIERAGGTALVNRVGHAFIKQRMREEDAVFAGEVSGHYYFRDFSQADSGVVPFLLMLELVSKSGRAAVGAPAAVPRALFPHRRDQLTRRRRRREAPRARRSASASEGRVGHLDGISVDGDDWHMNVSPSNTEPLLRLNLEARTKESMESRRDQLLSVIRS